MVGYNHVLLLGPGSDWRSGVLGRRQSLRQGCRRQALQEADAGGRRRESVQRVETEKCPALSCAGSLPKDRTEARGAADMRRGSGPVDTLM